MNVSGIFSTRNLQNIHLNSSSTSKSSGNVFLFMHFENVKLRLGRFLKEDMHTVGGNTFQYNTIQ